MKGAFTLIITFILALLAVSFVDELRWCAGNPKDHTCGWYAALTR